MAKLMMNQPIFYLNGGSSWDPKKEKGPGGPLKNMDGKDQSAFSTTNRAYTTATAQR